MCRFHSDRERRDLSLCMSLCMRWIGEYRDRFYRRILSNTARFTDDLRNVMAGGKADPKLGSCPIPPLVLQQAPANIARRNPDNRIFACIVGWRAPKQLNADCPFL
jgi:hypothetical protein